MSTNRLLRRAGQAGVVLSAAGLAVVLSAGAASAHVTARVIGETAKQGGFTKITFRVPNEDQTAGTTKVEVKFPTDTPVSSLRTKPVAGWTATVNKITLDKPVKQGDTEIKEAVGSVVWTANPGVRIGPTEFGEFEVSGGPMPATDKLVLPALQTYDNGKVVSWIEPPSADGKEPEHPAPVIQLAKADPKGGDDDMAAPAANGNSQAGNTGGTSGTAAASSTSNTDKTARWLGGIGLVVGALGLGVGAGATLRARRAIANTKVGEGS